MNSHLSLVETLPTSHISFRATRCGKAEWQLVDGRGGPLPSNDFYIPITHLRAIYPLTMTSGPTHE